MIWLTCHIKVKELRKAFSIERRIGLIKILRAGLKIHLIFMKHIRNKMKNCTIQKLKKLLLVLKELAKDYLK